MELEKLGAYPDPLQCPIGQGFGQNFNESYRGIKGHPAWDESCGYGSNIESYVDGWVYGVREPNKDKPNDYSSINMICETKTEIFEFVIGHVSEIDVKVNTRVSKGQVIGKEGNFGTVYSGNILVSESSKKRGSTRGSHRHVQKRPLYRVTEISPFRMYLHTTEGIYKDRLGFYYEYVFPHKDYAGCTDWTAPLFKKTLSIGSTGYEVYMLQKAMWNENLADYDPTGYFGAKTLKSVRSYQRKYGLKPAFQVGPKTRNILNNNYKPI